MPITYVAFGRRTPPVFESLSPDLEILAFDGFDERGVETVGDRFRRIDNAYLNVDIVVIRSSSPDLPDRLDSDAILPKLLARVPVVGMHRSRLAEDLRVQTYVPHWSKPGPVIMSDDLRQAELEAILRDGGAIFTGESAHYLLPSESHSDSFIRLADGLREVRDVRRFTDWILPWVSADTILLADTGTVLVLLQSLQNYCLAAFDWRIPIDSLEGYPIEPTILESIATQLQSMHGRSKSLLFLVSVNSSGAAVARFRSLELAGARELAICETNPIADSKVPFLVSLPMKRWDVGLDGRCPACSAGVSVVIGPKTYEQRAILNFKTISLTPARAERHRDFWTIASEKSAVRIHHNAFGGPDNSHRHLAVHLDVARMLDDNGFKSCAVASLSNLPKPNVVLIPEHASTDALEDLARRSYGNDLAVLRLDRGHVPKEAAEQLAYSERTLVLDDALVSGSTLPRIRRSAYLLTQPYGTNPPMNAFVVVARPETKADLSRVSRPFSDAAGSNFSYLVCVYLPRHCPWCTERALLSRWLDRLDKGDRETAVCRIRLLEGDIGSSPLLVPFLRVGPEERQPRTERSFFGSLDECTAFAAASSAVQELREDLRTVEQATDLAVFGVAAAISAFYDDIFLAAILRTCEERELRYAAQDSEVARELLALSDANTPERLLAELGWAAVLGRLPVGAVLNLFDRHVLSPPLHLIQTLLRKAQGQ